jgi:hypothetical protein
MVESYVVRAQKLATMSEQTFLASYGQVFRAMRMWPISTRVNKPENDDPSIVALQSELDS